MSDTVKISFAALSANEIIALADSLIANSEDWKQSLGQFLHDWFDQRDTIETETSGSTGTPKKILIAKNKMILSAKRTNRFFGLSAGSTVLLPMHCKYIGAKMMVARAIVGQYQLLAVPPQSDLTKYLGIPIDFTSMVPLQLESTVQNSSAKNWPKKILLGGSAVSDILIKKCGSLDALIFASYGMTETISHIAIRTINGAKKSSFYRPLEGVLLSTTPLGSLVINDQLLSIQVATNDIVSFHPNGFEIVGRTDNIINSGGIKINPEIIENELASMLQTEVYISAVNDEKLGQKVVLVAEKEIQPKLLSKAVSSLDKFHRPKLFTIVPQFPRTENGKINRKALHQLIKTHSLVTLQYYLQN